MCSSTRLLAPVIAILSGEFLPSSFLYLVRPRSFFLSSFLFFSTMMMTYALHQSDSSSSSSNPHSVNM
jgi:hypothetical protein